MPFEVTAICVLLVLFLGRAIDLEAALRGFSNSAVVTIGAVMVMSAGLANHRRGAPDGPSDRPARGE